MTTTRETLGFTILEDRYIRHRANVRGVVIAREQRIRNDVTGEETVNEFWHNWSAPTCPLVRVTSRKAA